MHEKGIFCSLPPAALSDLNSLRQSSLYVRGARLFVEGEPPRGIYILCSGLGRLMASSADGKAVTLRLVEAGEVLGLGSVIANEPYQATGEILFPSQVSLIPRLQFMQFLRAHGDVSLRVAKHLTMELHRAWDQTRVLALAPSTQAKVAQFLLAWAAAHGRATAEGVQLGLRMTHEEIAQSIGASRESVSRVLGGFKRQRLIRLNNGAVVILQPHALRSLTDGSPEESQPRASTA